MPPDHPLEPGTRPTGRVATPSERIAASENAISEIPASAREPANASNFIAAARRAAQAAQAQAANDKAPRSAKAKVVAGDRAKEPSTISSKIRSLLVGASVVVIVLGTFKMAMTLLDSGSPPPPAIENSARRRHNRRRTSPPSRKIRRQRPCLRRRRRSASNRSIPRSTAPRRRRSRKPRRFRGGNTPLADIGRRYHRLDSGPGEPAGRKLMMVQVPPTERLPDAIGGPNLRAAALKGDPTAAYEIAMRFAEGKGVAPNLDEAAKWYDRAAQAGLVPAIFRLGTFYEKGTSVKKDIDIARRYYMQAAERGNAKAMHNLAVLDADGGGKGADYKGAAQWFRKAADRGVADSQFNLGILYARGIGVEQNLAKSFKWFSLAAAQGDADSGHKRDDIAKRLDAQSLAAAKLAIQTFTPEPQPDDAINVATPAGGWDSAPVQAAKPTSRPAAKPVKRAAR